MKQSYSPVTTFFLLMIVSFLSSCSSNKYPPPADYPPELKVERKVKKLGFAIQVGAFSKIDNAVRLTKKLNRDGLDAYFFIHKSGLYKVRFGNFPNYSMALKQAINLKNNGRIEQYYIVKPTDYVISKQNIKGDLFVRKKLVSTAQRFLGIPYKWGGESKKTGFDCSGLTMVVYKLNGIALPRNSRAQFRTGSHVSKHDLRKGDLVFFATKKRNRVSHVGIYQGKGKFIHAPKRGKDIQVASLENGYFKKHYMGARTYL